MNHQKVSTSSLLYAGPPANNPEQARVSRRSSLRNRAMAVTFAAVMVGSFGLTAGTASADEHNVDADVATVDVTRIAGADRFATSAAISLATFGENVENVYIANGFDFPDALAAGSSAGMNSAPILLVAPDRITPLVLEELQRLTPGAITILGGTDSISAAVETELETLTEGAVTRLAGDDRFETAVEISKAAFENFETGKTVYISNGFAFPDALSVGPISGLSNSPLLLVTPTEIPTATSDELARLNPSQIVILGGPNTVSPAVFEALSTLTTAQVTRIAGSDRFETSAEISMSFFDGDVATIYIANGLSFPDALSAGPAGAMDNAPLLLVTTDTIPESIMAEIERTRPLNIVILGGVNSVSDAVEAQLASIPAQAPGPATS
jgi:putative cell wall-binding protein